MAFEQMDIERLRMISETTFGADATGTIGNLFDVRYDSAEANPSKEMLPEGRTVQRMFTRPLGILGKASCDLTVKGKLYGRNATLVAADANPTVPAGSLGKILKAIWGGWAGGKGTTITTGATTTSFPVADATPFSAGRAVGLTIGGLVEAMEIASIAGSTISGKMAVSGAPADGSVVRGCETFYPTDDPTESLQFLIESNDRDDIWLLKGMQGSIAFEFPASIAAAIPTWTLSLKGADYAHDDDIATPQGGAALAASTYIDDDPVVFVKSWILFGDGGVTTRVVLDSPQIQITTAFQYEPVPSVSGVNGIKRWRMVRKLPFAGCKITGYFGDESMWDKRDARTRMQLLVQVGYASKATWLFSLPNLQIVDVKRAPAAGFRGWEVTCEADSDQYATDQTTELRGAPIRAHQFG